MDSGFDEGGSSALEMRIAVLRGQLEHQRTTLETLVEELERNRSSGVFGHISVLPHATSIDQYAKLAENLLYLAPDNQQALDAIKHADQLRQRITG